MKLESIQYISEISFHYVNEDKSIVGCESFLNFGKKQFWYRRTAYGINGCRVNPKVDTKVVTKSYTAKIQSLIQTILTELEPINEDFAYDYDSFLEMQLTNGEYSYYKINKKIDNIFEKIDFEHSSKEPNVIMVPYLKYNTQKDVVMAELYEASDKYLRSKEIYKLYDYITDDCVVIYENLTLYGKEQITKEIKRRSGFLNKKLKKTGMYPSLVGYINDNNECELELYVDIFAGKRTEYTLDIKFNKDYKVNFIKFNKYKSHNYSKTIYKTEDLDKIKRKCYDDYKIETL